MFCISLFLAVTTLSLSLLVLKCSIGICVQDMKGKKDTELVGLVPGALETMRIKKEVLELGIAIGKEVTVTMDGFGKRWLVVACEPLRNKAGQILGVITACMDVTEQVLSFFPLFH